MLFHLIWNSVPDKLEQRSNWHLTMRPNKSSVALLILLATNKLLVGLRKVVNRFPISYNMPRVYVSFLRNSLAAICAKSMLLRENNSNYTLYIARVRTRTENKVMGLTKPMRWIRQIGQIGIVGKRIRGRLPFRVIQTLFAQATLWASSVIYPHH